MPGTTKTDKPLADGFPTSCSFCGSSGSFVVTGPGVCICVSCAREACKGVGCGTPETYAKLEAERDRYKAVLRALRDAVDEEHWVEGFFAVHDLDPGELDE